MLATRQNGVHKSKRVYCTNSRLYHKYNPGDVPWVSFIQSVSSLIIITWLIFLYNYSIRYIYLVIKLTYLPIWKCKSQTVTVRHHFLFVCQMATSGRVKLPPGFLKHGESLESHHESNRLKDRVVANLFSN